MTDAERLAAEFHRVYQLEAKRQGDVRHHDDYEALSENVKEFDRALSHYVLANFVPVAQLEAAQARVRELEAENAKLNEVVPVALKDGMLKVGQELIDREARVRELEAALAALMPPAALVPPTQRNEP